MIQNRVTVATEVDPNGHSQEVSKASHAAHRCPSQEVWTVTITGSTAVQWSRGLDVSLLEISLGRSSWTGYSTRAPTINHSDSDGWFCGVPAYLSNGGALKNVER